MALQLTRLFGLRFDPDVADRETAYGKALEEATRAVETHNTGHKMLDDFRRSIFRCTLFFIRRTLKTNFFVPEKHALAFRLDRRTSPTWDPTSPPTFPRSALPGHLLLRPPRAGFHIGFSDIARGGWRTIIAGTRDDFVTAANSLFRENYVLAHTQHLKNKDIYEGGSKMVTVLIAPGCRPGSG